MSEVKFGYRVAGEGETLLRPNVFAERRLVVEVDAGAGAVQSFLLVDRIAAAVSSTVQRPGDKASNHQQQQQEGKRHAHTGRYQPSAQRRWTRTKRKQHAWKFAVSGF